MPASELAICNRLRVFRQVLQWSQTEFAQRAGLRFEAYASYEYGRSCLNYTAAWKILTAFPMLNPLWLAEGSGPMLDMYFVKYPEPNTTGHGQRAQFSEVFAKSLKPKLNRTLSLSRYTAGAGWVPLDFRPHPEGRQGARNLLWEAAMYWVSIQPDFTFSDFVNALMSGVDILLKQYPPAPDIECTKNYADMLRLDPQWSGLPPDSLSETLRLTYASSSAKKLPVKPLLPDLLARLRRATAQPGQKSELAKYLAAPPESVSRWLSENREPGGEVALRMQLWVQLQERLNENPERATTRPGQKTQLSPSKQNEKAKPGRKNK